jgi:DNA-binding PadR family transcriptional regulator
MAKGEHLGEFEQLVLLAVLSLREEDAYGMNVRRALEEVAEREVSVPTVYAALERLEGKGLVCSELGEATPERGGRAKKLFRVEPEGVRMLTAARNRLERMWRAAALEPRAP